MKRCLLLLVTLAAQSCDRRGHMTGETAPPPDAAPDARVAVAAPTAPDAAPDPLSDEPLVTEEREANPRSESVRLKVSISPVPATVFWGRKKLGDTRPAEPMLEFERPRGSGPVDLVVRADGFLPHHVRMFTDRDDRISIRLVRPADAPGLLGYRRPVDAGP